MILRWPGSKRTRNVFVWTRSRWLERGELDHCSKNCVDWCLEESWWFQGLEYNDLGHGPAAVWTGLRKSTANCQGSEGKFLKGNASREFCVLSLCNVCLTWIFIIGQTVPYHRLKNSESPDSDQVEPNEAQISDYRLGNFDGSEE
jgi:hypothetical protein